MSYSLGLDFGTSSARGLIVHALTGEEVASATCDYPSGHQGVLLDSKDPLLARQNPGDYLKAIQSICHGLSQIFDLHLIESIGVDTTGSSPMPVNAQNCSLSEDFPHALGSYVWLWKDHTAFREAEEITQLASHGHFPYLSRCGGTYSSEWWWSKILACKRQSPEVFTAAATWVEICDWIPSVLCGISDPRNIKRSRCAAGHKAMFADGWGGLPATEFLAQLDPALVELRGELYSTVYDSSHIAGHVCQDIADQTGLKVGTPVAVGAFDAHLGAVGAGIDEGILVKIMGTSTCDCVLMPVSDTVPEIPGLCGVVRDSIVPGFYGLEAGQSAVGDIFQWVSSLSKQSQWDLTQEAETLAPGQSGLLALDWHNGNRTILVDPRLSGLILGLNIHSSAAEIYRAHIEATAFGALRIIERMEEYGVRIDQVTACGGIAEKSRLTMQVYANVLGRPIQVPNSSQTCALGSAMAGATAAGIHSSLKAAQTAMIGPPKQVYAPDPRQVLVYKELYALYKSLHDAFGTRGTADLSNVMKDLKRIQESALES